LKNGFIVCVLIIFIPFFLCSGSWLLSGKLAKMLLIDCEQNDNDYPLAISGMVGIGFLRFAVSVFIKKGGDSYANTLALE
jgi:hypothetical protein